MEAQYKSGTGRPLLGHASGNWGSVFKLATSSKMNHSFLSGLLSFTGACVARMSMSMMAEWSGRSASIVNGVEVRNKMPGRFSA